MSEDISTQQLGNGAVKIVKFHTAEQKELMRIDVKSLI